MSMATVLDASDQALGRLASVVAKRLLRGEEVVVVNAEKALITGDRLQILAEYRARRERGSVRKGPFYPRRADNIVWRTVRGMLPYQQPKGRVALKRLRVHIGVPSALSGVPAQRVAEAGRIRTARVVTVGEIARHLGAEG